MPNKKLMDLLNAWIEKEEAPKETLKSGERFSPRGNYLSTLLSLVYYVDRSLTYYKIILTKYYTDSANKKNFSPENSFSVERAKKAIEMNVFVLEDYLKKFIQQSGKHFPITSKYHAANIESLKKIHDCLVSPDSLSLKALLSIQSGFSASHRTVNPKFLAHINDFLTDWLVFANSYADDCNKREKLTKANDQFIPFLSIKPNSPRSTYKDLLIKLGFPAAGEGEELSSKTLERIKEKVIENTLEIERLNKSILNSEEGFKSSFGPELFNYILLWNLFQKLYQIAYHYQQSLLKEQNKNGYASQQNKDTSSPLKKGKGLSFSGDLFSLTSSTKSLRNIFNSRSFTPTCSDELSLEDCKNGYSSGSKGHTPTFRMLLRQS